MSTEITTKKTKTPIRLSDNAAKLLDALAAEFENKTGIKISAAKILNASFLYGLEAWAEKNELSHIITALKNTKDS